MRGGNKGLSYCSRDVMCGRVGVLGAAATAGGQICNEKISNSSIRVEGFCLAYTPNRRSRGKQSHPSSHVFVSVFNAVGGKGSYCSWGSNVWLY